MKEFLRFFGGQQSKRFCFILGAGASKSSGIPTGEELARMWLNQIREDVSRDNYRKWINDQSINENDPGRFYHQIFSKRFIGDSEYGNDELKKLMGGAKASLGYVYLAEILDGGKHNIVITTNFDSLTEDTYLFHTSKKALVIGHEDLANHIDPRPQQPEVIKVHHDLYLEPRNTKEGTEKISKGLEDGLREIFKIYVPIVIGYGGNDGGFMTTLRKVLKKSTGLYWCHRSVERPRDEINELVENKNGALVQIEGFDELLESIGFEVGIKLNPDKPKEGSQDEKPEHIDRTKNSNTGKQGGVLFSSKKNPSPGKGIKRLWARPWLYLVLIIATLSGYYLYNIYSEYSNGMEYGALSWETYQERADKETDIDKKEAIYTEGIDAFPESHQLLNNYASLLVMAEKNYNLAGAYYRRAHELEPDDLDIIRNYARFLSYHRGDLGQAEKLYLRALELEPNNPDTNENYAGFLSYHKGDFTRAEEYYAKAIELAPDDPIFHENYGTFLAHRKGKYQQARLHYLRALELTPKNTPDHLRIIKRYTFFLSDHGHDPEQTEEYYLKILELEPDDLDTNKNYAIFLANYRDSPERARKYYLRALELAPKDMGANINYAIFLMDHDGDIEQAETYFNNALELAPDDPDINAVYASFLSMHKGEHEKAEIYFQIALDKAPDNPTININYAYFLSKFKEDHKRAAIYLQRVSEPGPDNATLRRMYDELRKTIRNDTDDAK